MKTPPIDTIFGKHGEFRPGNRHRERAQAQQPDVSYFILNRVWLAFWREWEKEAGLLSGEASLEKAFPHES